MRMCFSVFTSILLCLLMVSCGNHKRENSPSMWTDRQVEDWFSQKEWLAQSSLQPNSAVSKRKLAELYYHNPERWDTAFSFVKRKNLLTLDTGRYEIDGANVYAIVLNYFTKSTDQVNFEVHRIYTDVHIVASGQEFIEWGDTSSSVIVQPYDIHKDVAMIQVKPAGKFLAKPGTFFIFSPAEAHRPFLKVDNPVKVKKIILKIKTAAD